MSNRPIRRESSAEANPYTYRPGTSKGARTAWIISYTPASRAPRVIRQAHALEGAGWRVFVFGLAGPTDCPPGWHFVELPADDPYLQARSKAASTLRALVIKGAAVLRRGALLVTRFGFTPGLRQAGGRLHQALILAFRWKREAIWSFFLESPAARPDLVLCHDYFTADIGLRLARCHGARFVVDCHEYARGQYMHDPRWVRWQRPCVTAVQDYYLSRADAVTTVCDGIASLLAAEQTLRRPIRVVRSMPFFSPQPFRPTGEVVTVLYHGEIYRPRGLHVAIRSMRLWRPGFNLVLRGYSDPAYVEELWRIARETGVEERLTIEPPVPFDQIVPAANRADIGYFVHHDTSPQKRFVLPNKFFEYVMAGLALCVSDLPEMAHLVKKYELGQLVSSCQEEAIAEAINSMDRERIDATKRRSIEAARELNWESEKHRMLSLYEELFR